MTTKAETPEASSKPPRTFLFKWVDQSGVLIAAAEDADAARALLLSKLMPFEKKMVSLTVALFADPQVLPNEPYVSLAFADDEDVSPEGSDANEREPREGKEPLHLFKWDTEIGEFAAFAKDARSAREFLMAKLAPNDFARGELAEAISSVPEIVTEPYATLAYRG